MKIILLFGILIMNIIWFLFDETEFFDLIERAIFSMAIYSIMESLISHLKL